MANGELIMTSIKNNLKAADVPHQVVDDPVLFDVVFAPQNVKAYRGVLAGDASISKRSDAKWFPSLALSDDHLARTTAAIEVAAKAL